VREGVEGVVTKAGGEEEADEVEAGAGAGAGAGATADEELEGEGREVAGERANGSLLRMDASSAESSAEMEGDGEEEYGVEE